MTPWAHAFIEALVVQKELQELLQYPPEFAQPHLWDCWKLQLSWKAKLHEGAHGVGGMPVMEPAPSQHSSWRDVADAAQ